MIYVVVLREEDMPRKTKDQNASTFGPGVGRVFLCTKTYQMKI